jgi:hypothetical protein
MTPRVLLVAGLCLLAASERPRPPSLTLVEEAFADLREVADALGIVRARGTDRSTADVPLSELVGRYGELRMRLETLLIAASRAVGLPAEDERALGIMERVFKDDLPKDPGAANSPPAPASASDATVAPDTAEGDLPALQEKIYASYGRAAHAVPFDGETLDRLTVLARLGRSNDPDVRRRLFLALGPVWQSVNGDGGPSSPYRRLLRLSTVRWAEGHSPVTANLGALGVSPDVMERWLVAVLQAWRDTAATRTLEPWDYWYEGGAAGRALDTRVSRADLRSLNDRFYASLGADIGVLNVHYDLEPRSGKTPVAFTDFGLRPRRRGEAWAKGEPWIFATYETGGFDNLVELLHETGHAIHIAAIRTRPAFADWPDSDTFTEALADVAALEAYEPDWQQRYLGAAAPEAASLRSKYSGIVLDIAWALLEVRLHREPAADPNQVWTEITSSYLKIAPHPELSWWAMRGQLVDAPGYMMNYAAGAILVADLRARARRLRGRFTDPDPSWYPWLSDRLYRFGLERTSRQVILDFIGRELSPEALLADLARLKRLKQPATWSSTRPAACMKA